MKPISIRIESDGTPLGTRVFDAKSGQRLHGVVRVSWEIEVDKASTATVTFICPEIIASGEVADVTGLGEKFRRHQRGGEGYKLPPNAE